MRISLIVALLMVAAGCDESASPSAKTAPAGPSVTAGPFGPPTALAIMKPFDGYWKFNLEKTLAQWKADGVAAKEIDEARALAKSFPLHADMTIAGDTAVLHERNEGEYHFYALHPHGRWVCGKAWHHEDRNDPGDMSKCLTRLEIRDAELYLTLRDHEDAADPNDPEVASAPPLAGSASTCTSDAQTDPAWSPWRSYIFERAAK